MDYKFPEGLKYTTTHEWVRVDSMECTVGITDFAQYQLGDIVFVELPEVGGVFEKGSNAGEIESVKAVGDFVMPLSGEVIEVNEKIGDKPELVNSSPYNEGWMIRIKISHLSEIDELITVDEYKEIVQKEMQ